MSKYIIQYDINSTKQTNALSRTPRHTFNMGKNPTFCIPSSRHDVLSDFLHSRPNKNRRMAKIRRCIPRPGPKMLLPLFRDGSVGGALLAAHLPIEEVVLYIHFFLPFSYHLTLRHYREHCEQTRFRNSKAILVQIWSTSKGRALER